MLGQHNRQHHRQLHLQRHRQHHHQHHRQHHRQHHQPPRARGRAVHAHTAAGGGSLMHLTLLGLPADFFRCRLWIHSAARGVDWLTLLRSPSRHESKLSKLLPCSSITPDSPFVQDHVENSSTNRLIVDIQAEQLAQDRLQTGRIHQSIGISPPRDPTCPCALPSARCAETPDSRASSYIIL